MGIWTGIKRALNSTLGTSDFKPLDQIIEGQRTLAASDSVIAVLSSMETSGNNVNVGEIAIFSTHKNGSVRVIADLKLNATGYTAYVIVKDADTEAIVLRMETTSLAKVTVSGDMPVTPGKNYKVIVSSTGSTAYASNVKIGANIVDTSLVTVL